MEESDKEPVVIFKYSSRCNTSTDLEKILKKAIEEKIVTSPIYKVTVQTEPVLSKNIAKNFGIKHESPQIIILDKGKVTYTAHHKNIRIENFVF